MNEVVLVAPFAGWLAPLEEVPDPVFAERMMGDGFAIDPLENVVRAPADATVIAIPETAHAATLRLTNGAELLIHIGLETVALGGKGFRALSAAGSQVKTGDPLIEIDLGEVAQNARSLLTPIVLANEGFELAAERLSRRVAAGDPIARIRGSLEPVAGASDGEVYERSVRVDAAHGLHARPAARIAAIAKRLGGEVSLARGERRADARSTVALMGLGARHGDEVRIAGRGRLARMTVDAIAELIEQGLGEQRAAAPGRAARRAGPACASPGIAVGTVVQLRSVDLPVPRVGEGAAAERKRLEQALDAVGTEMACDGGMEFDLAAAHRELLDDPDLLARAETDIVQGRSAAFAWRSACENARAAIRATGDPLLMERAADLLDVERRVIALLLGKGQETAPDLPPDAILIAADLLPSEFLALDPERIAGICTAEGGPTAHVALLAAASGIPMLVAAGSDVLKAEKGATAILDADRCVLQVDPTDEQIEDARERVAEQAERRATEARASHDLCFTADGTRIEVFANFASAADAQAAVEAGAEGCGLLRTEFLFMGRNAPPDQDEQARCYKEIAGALGDRPMIVRTIDIGADKKVPYLGIAAEENPALGLRGVRLSLARPDLFETQLRAILRAVPADRCRIMLPMVTGAHELREARAVLATLGAHKDVQLGVMIETPAAAILADELATEADFLSVGTNDLTQYALAADRTNPAVSLLLDGFHPAVLRLIRFAAEGAAKHGRLLGVCGGLASDPLAAPLLVGLGVTELSAVPAAVPTVKAAVRRLRIDRCRELAVRACAVASAEEVRAIAAEAMA